MANDGSQAEKENKTVELEGFDRDSIGSLTLEGFEVEDSKTKHPSHGSVGHEEGKISTRQHGVNKERRSKKTSPEQDVLVQGLQSDALLSFGSFRFVSIVSLIWCGNRCSSSSKCQQRRESVVSCVRKRLIRLSKKCIRLMEIEPP